MEDWDGEGVERREQILRTGEIVPFSIHTLRHYEEKPHNADIYRNLEQDLRILLSSIQSKRLKQSKIHNRTVSNFRSILI